MDQGVLLSRIKLDSFDPSEEYRQTSGSSRQEYKELNELVTTAKEWAENTDWIPDQRNPQRELHEISQTTPGSAEDVPEDEQKIECIEQARESSERK